MRTSIYSFAQTLVRTLGGLLALFLILQTTLAVTSRTQDLPHEGVPSKYSVYAVSLPKHMMFAGERVPTELFDVRETIEREFHLNTYLQSSTLLILKRAKRFFPVVEPILREEGIPDDFKYLMVIESGMQDVVSPAGAAGFWQFMEGTGKEYDLEIYSEVDQRYQLEAATHAAAKYLKWMYEKFKSWTVVAAAYNRGRAGMIRAMRHQQVDNYWDMYLNAETTRYVPRILALKYIMQNPESYGFNIKNEQKYPVLPTRDVVVTETIDDLAEWSRSQGTTYKMLLLLNPWLRTKKLTISEGNSYTIKLLRTGFREPLLLREPSLLDSLE